MDSEAVQEVVSIGAAVVIGVLATTVNGIFGELVFLAGLGLFAFGMIVLAIGRIRQDGNRDRKP